MTWDLSFWTATNRFSPRLATLENTNGGPARGGRMAVFA